VNIEVREKLGTLILIEEFSHTELTIDGIHPLVSSNKYHANEEPKSRLPHDHEA
jgi:hypothetical protein